MTLCLPVKFRPSRFRFAGVISEKVILYELEVGRVPGDYPVPAGYCTTRHYPDPAGYYFKIWPDPDPENLC